MLRVAIAANSDIAGALIPEFEYAGLQISGTFAVEELEAELFGPTRGAGANARERTPFDARSGSAVGAGADAVSGASVAGVLAKTDVLLVHARSLAPGGTQLASDLLGPELRATCDRRGIRIVVLVENDDAQRRVHALGWAHAASLHSPVSVVAAIRGDTKAGRGSFAMPDAAGEVLATGAGGKVFTVWGAGGAPGRSTLAIELAYELARGGRTVALVDADTYGPSLALALGLADEGPGFAAACRAADVGMLDADELTRISTPIAHHDGHVRVLTGLNRPGRWPELNEERVFAALEVCRAWADYVVVDVAAPLERDEEIVSDLDGLRRNAATFGALRAADHVVAVASIEPVSIARFVRGYVDLRALVGATPVAVVVNRLRSGALGVDARGQVRAALTQFAGVEAVSFLPFDSRATDAAMLAANPIAISHPNAPLIAAVRRLVGDVLLGSQGSQHRQSDGLPERDTPSHRFNRARRRRAASQPAEVGTSAI